MPCSTTRKGHLEEPIPDGGKNRQYGQYLGHKFASAKNLFWIMGGDNDPKGDRECLLAMIEGLREAAPAHQIMTYHASPPHSSTDPRAHGAETIEEDDLWLVGNLNDRTDVS